MLRMILTRVPNYDQWEHDKGLPMLNEPVLAHDSEQWRATAEKQELNLLSVPERSAEVDVPTVADTVTV